MCVFGCQGVARCGSLQSLDLRGNMLSDTAGGMAVERFLAMRTVELTALLARQQSEADHEAALRDYANSIDRNRQARVDAGSDSDVDIPPVLPDPGAVPPDPALYMESVRGLVEVEMPLRLLVETSPASAATQLPRHLQGIGSALHQTYGAREVG